MAVELLPRKLGLAGAGLVEPPLLGTDSRICSPSPYRWPPPVPSRGRRLSAPALLSSLNPGTGPVALAVVAVVLVVLAAAAAVAFLMPEPAE